MTNNIQNTQFELIEKKFNVTSLLLSLVLIGLGCFLFIYSGNIESNMISSSMIFFGIAIVAVAIFGLIGMFISTHNELVTRRNKVANSWAHIDAQLQRRFELVPNLVEIVRSYMEHEKDVLSDMDKVLKNYMHAISASEKLAMDNELNSYLKSLYTIIEKYPTLKSNQQLLKLQEALTEIEEDITYANAPLVINGKEIKLYNKYNAVTIYNNKLMSFPGNVIGKKFGFEPEDLFDACKEAEYAPKVNLGTNRKCHTCGAAQVIDRNSCPYCGSPY